MKSDDVIKKIALLLTLLPATLIAAEPQAMMPAKHLSVFRKYCFDCHDAESKEGKLDLEGLSFEISKDIPTAEWWSKILAALNAGEMPPMDSELVTGGGAGFRHGRHLVMDKKTPLCNLWLSVLRGSGVRADSFGDANGVIDALFKA